MELILQLAKGVVLEAIHEVAASGTKSHLNTEPEASR